MNCLVTGAAGFIGSSLSQRLIQNGYFVTGIDSFTDYYPRWIKEKNLNSLFQNEHFEFIEEDIASLHLKELMKKSDAVFHLAAQAGVRSSWGNSFSIYTKNNIEATQRLLEAVKEIPVEKFIFASSSSVYGDCPHLPMSETSPLHPFSPYGVTKLAAENLCSLYFKNYGVPVVSLRYFTVYGPGQRPDMAFHKFFKAIRQDKKITVFGNGKQTRDFTYIDDLIEANVSALKKARVGEIYNIGGGNRQTLEDLFPILETICQKNIHIKKKPTQSGDVPHTFADIEKAQKELDYSPQSHIEEGLLQEWKWIQHLYDTEPTS
ncbi:GDP-mannose 4,6-dehydratase [bacterium]|nr:GDP-mannose 4,6-dehydratase [bacterium]